MASRSPLRPRVVRVVALAASAVTLVACSSGPAELSEQDQAVIDAADVAVVGGDDLSWDPEELEVDAGELSIAVTCEQAVNHNLAIDDEVVVECGPGETASGTVTLEPGTHEFVCTVPGHERRMRGTITAG